jgi:hypothetical protein
MVSNPRSDTDHHNKPNDTDKGGRCLDRDLLGLDPTSTSKVELRPGSLDLGQPGQIWCLATRHPRGELPHATTGPSENAHPGWKPPSLDRARIWLCIPTTAANPLCNSAPHPPPAAGFLCRNVGKGGEEGQIGADRPTFHFTQCVNTFLFLRLHLCHVKKYSFWIV